MTLCRRCGFEVGGVLCECVTVGSLRVTRAEAERAGLLPEQIRARAGEQAAFLTRVGHGGTALVRALRVWVQP